MYLLLDLENFDEKFLTTINHEQSLLLLAKNYRENDVKIVLQIFQNWSKSSQNDRLSCEMLVKVIVETQGGVHQKFSKLFIFSIFFFRRKNWVICFDHENWTENENKQVSECKGLVNSMYSKVPKNGTLKFWESSIEIHGAHIVCTYRSCGSICRNQSLTSLWKFTEDSSEQCFMQEYSLGNS